MECVEDWTSPPISLPHRAPAVTGEAHDARSPYALNTCHDPTSFSQELQHLLNPQETIQKIRVTISIYLR